MPDWKEEIARRLASLKLPPAREAEIVEEVAQHLDGRYRELLAGGAQEVKQVYRGPVWEVRRLFWVNRGRTIDL